MDKSLSFEVIGCAMQVHHNLGPGLLESIYEKAMMIELKRKGIAAVNQVPVRVMYEGEDLGEGLRLDILVNDELIVELKSVEELRPIHYKQLQTYLKVTNKRLGLLINFNENDVMDGVHRVISDNY